VLWLVLACASGGIVLALWLIHVERNMVVSQD